MSRVQNIIRLKLILSNINTDPLGKITTLQIIIGGFQILSEKISNIL